VGVWLNKAQRAYVCLLIFLIGIFLAIRCHQIFYYITGFLLGWYGVSPLFNWIYKKLGELQ